MGIILYGVLLLITAIGGAYLVNRFPKFFRVSR